MVSIIVAHELNRGIGYKNQLPWPPLREDLKHFKSVTLNSVIIMGRNTWESLSRKPLPNRTNVVISSTLECGKGYLVYPSVEMAINDFQQEDIFIIGGEQLYKYCLSNDLVDEIIVSEINADYVCDTFFPELDESWIPKTVEDYGSFRVIVYVKDHSVTLIKAQGIDPVTITALNWIFGIVARTIVMFLTSETLKFFKQKFWAEKKDVEPISGKTTENKN